MNAVTPIICRQAHQRPIGHFQLQVEFGFCARLNVYSVQYQGGYKTLYKVNGAV